MPFGRKSLLVVHHCSICIYLKLSPHITRGKAFEANGECPPVAGHKLHLAAVYMFTTGNTFRICSVEDEYRSVSERRSHELFELLPVATAPVGLLGLHKKIISACSEGGFE